ncbi:MAG: TlpA disulfide reductase family protein [Bryobacteraceae bacterium]
MSTHQTRMALAAALAFVGIACSTSSPVRAAVKAEKDRKNAPGFALKDSMGRTVNLSDYKGKVVLLNFWATWCGPCKLEIPWFMEFEQKYKDNGLAVLGVSLDEEGWDVVKPYLERTKINYRILLGDDAVAQMYGGVDALPSSFIIDREGRIAAVHIGLVSKSEYQKDLDALLGLNGKKSAAGFPMPAVVAPALHLGGAR